MSDTITVTGNIATDPEHKVTQGGLSITTFRVASSQRRFDRQSERWVDSGTNWYTVSTYRGLADHAFQSLRKGDRVLLTGRLRVRQWENGTKQGTSVDVDAEAIGHDLLWGTTVFQRDAPGSTASSVRTADDAWAAPSASTEGSGRGEGWPAPGVPNDAAALAEGELVGAEAVPF